MDVALLDELRIVLDPIGQAGVAIALMLVMFGVALGLRVQDFRRLMERPRIYFGGVFSQIVVLPLLTYALVVLLAPPPSIALGMIIVACCPGGSVSNLFTWLSRGDVAVSVALTATSSALAALLTPALTLFWVQSYAPTAALLKTLGVNPWLFVGQTTVLLAIPLFAGMLLTAQRPALAAQLKRRATFVGVAVLMGTIVYGIVYFYPILWPVLSLIAAITILHNAIAFCTGAAAGFMLSHDSAVRRALTFEVGIQNSGLALVILLSELQGVGGAAAVAAFWGIWHLIAGSVLALVFHRCDAWRLAVSRGA